MPVYNTSPVEGGLLQQPGAPGAYREIKGGLAHLAGSLQINATRIDPSRMKSIPDTWSQAESFKLGLFDQPQAEPRTALAKAATEAHGEAVGTWRGLLSMLALRRFDRRFEIQITRIDLEKRAADTRSNRLLESILFDYRPLNSVDANIDWKSVYLIRVRAPNQEPQALGLLSPETIVMPSRSVGSVSIADVPYLQNGIHDPLATGLRAGQGKMTPEELYAIRQFVLALRRRVKNATPHPPELSISRLIDRLNEFERDLEAAGAGIKSNLPVEHRDELVVGDSADGGFRGSLFDVLNTIWQQGEVKGAVSDSYIECEQISGFDGVVLIDPAVAATRGQSLDRVIGWRQHRLGQLLDKEHFEAARANALQVDGGYLLLRPEDIFSENFVPLSKEEQQFYGVIKAHDGEAAHALLPLRPIALLLFQRRDLLASIEISDEKQGRWAVVLKLKLRDSNQQPYEHKIRREYVAFGSPGKPGPGVGRALVDLNAPNRPQPPVAVAWPNFSHASWRFNYLYWDANPHTGLAPITGASRAQLNQDLSERTGLGRLDRLKELESSEKCWPEPMSLLRASKATDDSHWFTRVSIARADDHVAEIQRCDFPFEAVLFHFQPGNMWRGTGFRESERVYAGFGFLTPAKKIVAEPGTTSATVAMDFGTTNTTVYSRIGGDIKPVQFHDRLRRVFHEEEKIRDEAYIRFLPEIPGKDESDKAGRTIGLPFSTVLQIRALSGGVNGETIRATAGDPVLWLNYIFFGDRGGSERDEILTRSIDSVLGPGAAGLEMEFKWTNDPALRRLTRVFIGQAALMSLAEIIDRNVHPHDVTWAVSFPEAMNGATRKNFQDSWGNVLRDLRSAPLGRTTPGFEEARDVGYYSEGEAAAVFFKEETKKHATSLIVLDIGGGTTDISVWRDDNLLWQDSFMLAGRELIISFLMKNRAFLKQLDIAGIVKDAAHKATILGESGSEGGNNDRNVRKVISFLVNSLQFDQAFKRRFPEASGTTEGERLTVGARVMLAGLLYYVGQQVRKLMEADGLKATAFNAPLVALAGRGSKIFTYLHDKRRADSPLAASMTLFKAGAMLTGEIRPDVVFSREPKHEVAWGMLYSPPQAKRKDTKDHGRDDRRVLGELIVGTPTAAAKAAGADGTLEAMDPMSKLRELDPDSLEDQSLPELVKFLKTMKTESGLELTISDEGWTSLKENLRKEMAAYIAGEGRLRGLDDYDYEVGPPFIGLLRHLLWMIYDQRALVTFRES